VQQGPLSRALREATAQAHQAAERRQFVGALLRGAIPFPLYARYLASLRLGYTVLEDALDAGIVPLSTIFSASGLRRRSSLNEDLQSLQEMGTAPVEPAIQWQDHLRTLRADAPLLLVAHAYTRYLGDLSGGQMIGTRLHSLWGADAPLAFYAFPEISDADGCKRAIRGQLDVLGGTLSKEEHTALLNEAIIAFEMNGRIFDALMA